MSEECMRAFFLGYLAGAVLWVIELIALVSTYAKWEREEIARLDAIINDLEDKVLILEGRPPKNKQKLPEVQE